ncbi:hypothetical protein EA462_13065 [Natrarchaeobius halalkaliphilus]|uniref:DUF8074 domain-containing protein n=1 Tax=Natrarchaeobius halalkaliphilus TaxID=1679091 RepID=A0A3N6LNP3_9EURY|nr:hypothetical protein [Natrarchaeobius halalkaliphilus]RQG87797.1 hypothetical protein EA462_13065 [Natrarchaeobius halalkaliphilus]
MQITWASVSVLLYNYGVVLSAAYITMAYGINDRVTILLLAFVFAVFWTVYFEISMVDKIVPSDGSEEKS